MDRLKGIVEGGRAVIVGTVDANGNPTCCRGIAVATNDDFDSVVVYVPVATGQETVANIATTRRVAVASTHPITAESVQIKGVTRGVRVASPAERAYVVQRLEDFASILDGLGLPRRLTLAVAHWPAFAIEVSVEQVFDQTPGPNAGAAVR
jgi:hypothetical protein